MQSIDFKEQERARPSGTHSFKEPSRTQSEYAPKDAPRLGTPFACSSSDKSIDGILNEPLQRITLNQTARGVAARFGPPSSLPIAPTRTTPAPTRESIAQSRPDGAGNFRERNKRYRRVHATARDGSGAGGAAQNGRQQADDNKGAARWNGRGIERHGGRSVRTRGMKTTRAKRGDC